MNQLNPSAFERWLQESQHEQHPHGVFQHVDCHICGPGITQRGMVPSRFPHVFYKVIRWSDGYSSGTRRDPVSPLEADVVSSEIDGELDRHTLMLDVDMPISVIPSSTPGHYHLYADVKMSWWRYRMLLRQLMKVGLIEPGYYRASVQRRATHLRPPWVKKL